MTNNLTIKNTKIAFNLINVKKCISIFNTVQYYVVMPKLIIIEIIKWFKLLAVFIYLDKKMQHFNNGHKTIPLK